MFLLISTHASLFLLSVIPAPNQPLRTVLLSSTNCASSNNWSCYHLGFLVFFSRLIFSSRCAFHGSGGGLFKMCLMCSIDSLIVYSLLAIMPLIWCMHQSIIYTVFIQFRVAWKGGWSLSQLSAGVRMPACHIIWCISRFFVFKLHPLCK